MAPEHDVWRQLSPSDAAELVAGFPEPWWIAGGWAIDLFLGRTTRAHADVDIAILRGAEPALRAHVPTWDVRIAHNGTLEAWDGDLVRPPRHQFWSRPEPGEPWALEFLLEDHHVGMWRFRRDPRVTMPLHRLGSRTDGDLPFVCPEIALLYKAKFAEADDNARDFAATAPLLEQDARHWLRSALERTHPGHAWTAALK